MAEGNVSSQPEPTRQAIDGFTDVVRLLGNIFYLDGLTVSPSFDFLLGHCLQVGECL
jgi:hypothetical protein